MLAAADGPHNQVLEGERALERLGHDVRADEAGDDDSRGDTKPFAGEIDCLDGFLALELLDLEWMAIKTVRKGRWCGRWCVKGY